MAYHTIVSRKRAHGRSHYLVLIQGCGQIFVTSLHFAMKNRPCLHYDNLQQDIAHQHTCAVLLAAVKFWIAGGDASFGIVRISRSNELKCA